MMTDRARERRVINRLLDDSVFAHVFHETKCSSQSEYMFYKLGPIEEEDRGRLVRYNVTMNNIDRNSVINLIHSKMDPFQKHLLQQVANQQEILPKYRRHLCMVVVMCVGYYLHSKRDIYSIIIESAMKNFLAYYQDVRDDMVPLSGYFVERLVESAGTELDASDRLSVFTK